MFNFFSQIKSDDFDTMREQYCCWLYWANYDDKFIKECLQEFDNVRAAEDYEWILNKMDRIGVELV